MLFYSVVVIAWAATSLATPPPGYVKKPDNDKDPPAYEYRYQIGDGNGDGQGKEETRSGEFASGSYYVNTGQAATDVKYFADDWGYHPVVKYGSADEHSSTTARFALGEHAVKAFNNGGDVGHKVELSTDPGSQKRRPIQIIQPYLIEKDPGYQMIESDGGAAQASGEYPSFVKESGGLISTPSHSTTPQEIAHTATSPVPIPYAPLQEVRDIYANNDYQNAALIDEQLFLQSAAGNFGQRVQSGESGLKQHAYSLTKQNGDVTYNVHSGVNSNTAYLSAARKIKKTQRLQNRYQNRDKIVSSSTERPNYYFTSTSQAPVATGTPEFTSNDLVGEKQEKYEFVSPSQEFTKFGPADPNQLNYGLASENFGTANGYLQNSGLQVFSSESSTVSSDSFRPIVVAEVTPGYEPEHSTACKCNDDLVVLTTPTPILSTTPQTLISDTVAVTPKYQSQDHITTSAVILNPIQAGVALVNAGEAHLISDGESSGSVEAGVSQNLESNNGVNLEERIQQLHHQQQENELRIENQVHEEQLKKVQQLQEEIQLQQVQQYQQEVQLQQNQYEIESVQLEQQLQEQIRLEELQQRQKLEEERQRQVEQQIQELQQRQNIEQEAQYQIEQHQKYQFEQLTKDTQLRQEVELQQVDESQQSAQLQEQQLQQEIKPVHESKHEVHLDQKHIQDVILEQQIQEQIKAQQEQQLKVRQEQQIQEQIAVQQEQQIQEQIKVQQEQQIQEQIKVQQEQQIQEQIKAQQEQELKVQQEQQIQKQIAVQQEQQIQEQISAQQEQQIQEQIKVQQEQQLKVQREQQIQQQIKVQQEQEIQEQIAAQQEQQIQERIKVQQEQQIQEQIKVQQGQQLKVQQEQQIQEQIEIQQEQQIQEQIKIRQEQQIQEQIKVQQKEEQQQAQVKIEEKLKQHQIQQSLFQQQLENYRQLQHQQQQQLELQNQLQNSIVQSSLGSNQGKDIEIQKSIEIYHNEPVSEIHYPAVQQIDQSQGSQQYVKVKNIGNTEQAYGAKVSFDINHGSVDQGYQLGQHEVQFSLGTGSLQAQQVSVLGDNQAILNEAYDSNRGNSLSQQTSNNNGAVLGFRVNHETAGRHNYQIDQQRENGVLAHEIDQLTPHRAIFTSSNNAGYPNQHSHSHSHESNRGQQQVVGGVLPYTLEASKELILPGVSASSGNHVTVLQPYPPAEKVIEKTVHIPYPVEKKVPFPVEVEKVIEKQVPVHVLRPYPVEVEKVIEKKVPYPVDRIVEKHVPILQPYPVHIKVPHPYPVEKIIEKPYPIETIIEKPVHIHVPVEKIVEKKVPVPQPYPIEVEKIIEKKVPYPVEVTKYVDKIIRIPYAVDLGRNVPYGVHYGVSYQQIMRPHAHNLYVNHGKTRTPFYGLPVARHQEVSNQFQGYSYDKPAISFVEGGSEGQHLLHQNLAKHTVFPHYPLRRQHTGGRISGIEKTRNEEYIGPVPPRSSQLRHIQHSKQNKHVVQARSQQPLTPATRSPTSTTTSRRIREPETKPQSSAGNFRQSRVEYGFKPPMIPSVQYDEKTATKVES